MVSRSSSNAIRAITIIIIIITIIITIITIITTKHLIKRHWMGGCTCAQTYPCSGPQLTGPLHVSICEFNCPIFLLLLLLFFF
jgi:hypothetical protein